MGLHVQLLTLTAQTQADEVTEVLQGQLTLDLKLERQRAAAIRPRLLADFDHQVTRLRFGENQFSTHIMLSWEPTSGTTRRNR